MPDKQQQKQIVRVGRKVSVPTPKISVVIPAYNAALFIAETLDSVVTQTFDDYEIIVVNDGSPDTELFERSIAAYQENIIYIQQPNSGASVARNTAIEHARGKIIAFLDGDDIWFPDFLAAQYEFLEGGGYDMVYCDAELFGMSGTDRKTFMASAPSVGEADFDAILDLRCNVITSGTMARKQAVERAGMFENERVQAEDFHLWLRMAKSGAKIGYQKKQLLKYRVRLDSLSGDSISRIKRGIDVFERVGRTIDLTAEQRQIINRHIRGFEADIAVEQGKAFLLSGNYREAAISFREANRYRKSPKLTAISLLTRIAPQTLVKFYKTNRPADIAFVPNAEKST